MKVWTVITEDGEKYSWWATWRNVMFGRFPKVKKDGIVWLDGFPYVPNPDNVIREHYRPKKYLGLIQKQDDFYYWNENEPAQIKFNGKLTPDSIGITGKTISQYSKSQHLQRLVAPETNWALVAIICILVGVMAGAIGYSLGISQPVVSNGR